MLSESILRISKELMKCNEWVLGAWRQTFIHFNIRIQSAVKPLSAMIRSFRWEHICEYTMSRAMSFKPV